MLEKFTKILIFAALLGSISVEGHRLIVRDDDEKNPDADAKQPKKIDTSNLDADLAQAKADEAKQKEKDANAEKIR